MEHLSIEQTLERVRSALESHQTGDAIALIGELRPVDKAAVFSELKWEDQVALLTRMKTTDSADIVEKLEDEQAADLALALPPQTLIGIVDEMEPDEAADLLGDIPTDQAQTVLAGLDDPEIVHPLLMHPDDRAGGLMTSTFLALRRRTTVGEAVQTIREWKPSKVMADHFFVIDREGVLRGKVSLHQLILADPHQRIMDVMDTDVVSVPAGTDQEECAHLMERYDMLALPVVDDERHLLGIITVDDLVDVLREEVTEDIQRLGGSQPLDAPYLASSISQVARSRIGWLLILFLTETLTGTVLRLFQNELAAVVSLTFFIPLLIGTGGNAGSQTISTIVRSLAIREIRPQDATRVMWHEMRVGLLLGIAMGMVGFVRAMIWGTTQGVAISVSLALLVIVLWANTVGSLLPVLASRLRIDPAIISGPFMSTLVDATGLMIYLYIAKVVLGV